MNATKPRMRAFFGWVAASFRKANPRRAIAIKPLLFLAVAAAVFATVFGLRARFAPFLGQGTVQNTGFININVITNSGIGFGQLQDSTALVYFLQSFLALLFAVSLLFVARIEFLAFLSLICVGALSNVFDRASSAAAGLAPNVVLDYFQFWFGGAIFNFADSAITVGFVGLFASAGIFFVVQAKKARRGTETKEGAGG